MDMTDKGPHRRLTEEEIAACMRDWPRPKRPLRAPIRLRSIFLALFCGALLGFLIGLDPMGLYVAEVLK